MLAAVKRWQRAYLNRPTVPRHNYTDKDYRAEREFHAAESALLDIVESHDIETVIAELKQDLEALKLPAQRYYTVLERAERAERDRDVARTALRDVLEAMDVADPDGYRAQMEAVIRARATIAEG